MLVCQWCVGTTRQEAWEWALVNKYGKVCYTNSPKPKFSTSTSIFQRSVVSIYDTRASWGAPEIKNSSDLGFVARPSFEVGQIDRLANVHLIGSPPPCPPRAGVAACGIFSARGVGEEGDSRRCLAVGPPPLSGCVTSGGEPIAGGVVAGAGAQEQALAMLPPRAAAVLRCSVPGGAAEIN